MEGLGTSPSPQQVPCPARSPAVRVQPAAAGCEAHLPRDSRPAPHLLEVRCCLPGERPGLCFSLCGCRISRRRSRPTLPCPGPPVGWAGGGVRGQMELEPCVRGTGFQGLPVAPALLSPLDHIQSLLNPNPRQPAQDSAVFPTLPDAPTLSVAVESPLAVAWGPSGLADLALGNAHAFSSSPRTLVTFK